MEALAGVIKSDHPTPRATNFLGRASENFLLAHLRTSVFFLTSFPKLTSYKRVKINIWLLNTRTGRFLMCVLSIGDVIECINKQFLTVNRRLSAG